MSEIIKPVAQWCAATVEAVGIGIITALALYILIFAIYRLFKKDAAEEYLLRGRIRTGADGRYAYDTILPGNYRMGRNWARARHIHLIVSHPPGRRLTTQLYFAGDPLNKTDPLVKSALVVPLRDTGDGLAGTFDITLS